MAEVRLEQVRKVYSGAVEAVKSVSFEVPAGRITSGASEQLVRVAGRIEQPEQFGNVIVATRDGQPVRVRDVAVGREGSPDERSLALVNGARAVAIDGSCYLEPHEVSRMEILAAPDDEVLAVLHAAP